MNDNSPMKRLVTLRRCALALALALVQLVVPVSAYTQMAHAGVLLQDVCSVSGTRLASQNGGDSQGDGQTPAANHGQHCVLCGTSPAMLAAAAVGDFVEQMPEGVIRIGGLWYQPSAVAPTPPATGPPRAA